MKGKRPLYRKGTALRYQAILEQIESELAQVDEWRDMDDYGRAAQYFNKAEALIELLEVYNCGSIGGFDKGQDSDQDSVLERFAWLKKKGG